MNNTQENRFRMYQAVKGVLESNQSIYEAFAILKQKITEFNGNIDEIKNAATQSGTDTTGITEAKSECKEKMALVATELASALKAYGFDTQNTQLEAIADYSYSDIRYASDMTTL